jgi:protein-tyrosine phosphatase
MEKAPVLLLPKDFNFRDIGGLKTNGGSPTKAGILYRSAQPTKIDGVTFQELLQHHGIVSIIDLRSSEEFGGSILSDEAFEYHHRSIPLFPVINHSWVNPKDTSPEATSRRYFEMLEVGAVSIRRIIEQIVSEPDGGVLIHCAAGRDRTGIVFAVLLGLVNVEKGEIAFDYGKSNLVVSDGYFAQPDTIIHLFDLIDSKYGSILDFMLSTGISQEYLNVLKNRVVEK